MKRKVVQKHFELTEYENKVLKSLTAKSGSGKEVDVIRDLILGCQLMEAPGGEFYDAVNEIRKIGVNMNQIAHMANATGMVDAEAYRKLAGELEEKLLEIKRIVLEPRKKQDIGDIIRHLEYAIWETEEEQRTCWRIQNELKELMGAGKADVHIAQTASRDQLP